MSYVLPSPCSWTTWLWWRSTPYERSFSTLSTVCTNYVPTCSPDPPKDSLATTETQDPPLLNTFGSRPDSFGEFDLSIGLMCDLSHWGLQEPKDCFPRNPHKIRWCLIGAKWVLAAVLSLREVVMQTYQQQLSCKCFCCLREYSL